MRIVTDKFKVIKFKGEYILHIAINFHGWKFAEISGKVARELDQHDSNTSVHLQMCGQNHPVLSRKPEPA